MGSRPGPARFGGAPAYRRCDYRSRCRARRTADAPPCIRIEGEHAESPDGGRGSIAYHRAKDLNPSLGPVWPTANRQARSEEHTSELQSLMRISYAVFCLKKKTNKKTQ